MWHHADETERKTWQNPEEILITGGPKAGMTLLEIVCVFPPFYR